MDDWHHFCYLIALVYSPTSRFAIAPKPRLYADLPKQFLIWYLISLVDLVPMLLQHLPHGLLLARLECGLAGFGDAKQTLDPIAHGNDWLRFAPVWWQSDRLRIIFPRQLLDECV
jgi:hypothetical protein